MYATISLDDSDYRKGIDNAAEKTNSFSSKLKSGLGGAAKVAAAGVAAVTTAVVGLAKKSVEAYADYEQLVGGVETLFKDNADAVIKYAENAYKTAGLSANQYMETVTSFSASLLQSLGGDTEAAASVADVAITDMADNANKMGTSMESIQNAYQGFAKANYTMLDNLKLGYGGTKEEMERLIADANRVKEANGEMADLSIDSFADITEAIHIIQSEMGITGATAAEASSTISGSVASMKAAWQNLLTGLANGNADINTLLNDFLESVKTVGENILPVIKTAVENILQLLEENGPEMLAKGVVLIAKLGLGLIQAIPELVARIPEIVRAIVEEFKAHGPEFTAIGNNIIQLLNDGVVALASLATEIGEKVINWIKTGISNAWGSLTAWVREKWQSLLNIFSFEHVNMSAINGSHAGGLDYVPFNGYVAELHRGEAVLTASEAEDYRRGKANRNSGVNVVQNIYSQAKTAADLMQEALYLQERAVLLGV